MSLSVGDIFEGVYQLEERVQESEQGRMTRWRADDITAYRRAEVLIDTYQLDYDPLLYWYGKIDGLRKIGQSADVQCRYFVWELGKAQIMVPVNISALNEDEKQKFRDLIDALPVAAHENIFINEEPVIWQTETGELLVFYRKHEGNPTTFKQKQLVRKVWKKKLNLDPEKITDPLPRTPNESSTEPARATNTKWSLLTIVIGIILFLVIYQAIPPKPSGIVTSFHRSLDQGIAEAEKGSYESALEHFKTAVASPEDSETDARLEGLARRYQERARLECARYKVSGSVNLYFIPNQYYHYAAVLSRQPTPEICQ